MSEGNREERKKKMEILRWASLMGDFVVAIVFVVFAEPIGDIAYVVAVTIVALGFVYFILWPRLFRSTYSGG